MIPDPVGIILGFAALGLFFLFLMPFFKAGELGAKVLKKDTKSSEGQQIALIISLVFLIAFFIVLAQARE